LAQIACAASRGMTPSSAMASAREPRFRTRAGTWSGPTRAPPFRGARSVGSWPPRIAPGRRMSSSRRRRTAPCRPRSGFKMGVSVLERTPREIPAVDRRRRRDRPGRHRRLRAQEPTGTTGVLPPEAYEAPPPSPSPERPRVRGVIQPARPPQPEAAAPQPTPVRPQVQAAAAPADLPLDARPGQCFARVRAPRQTETYQAQLLSRPSARKPARSRPSTRTRRCRSSLRRAGRAGHDSRHLPHCHRDSGRSPRRGAHRAHPRAGSSGSRSASLISEGGLQWRPPTWWRGPGPPTRAGCAAARRARSTAWSRSRPCTRTVQRQVLVEPERAISRSIPPSPAVTRRVIDQPARVEERVGPPSTAPRPSAAW
jgi:hypothetical protein